MVDKQYFIETNKKLLSRWNETHQGDTQPIGVRGDIDDIIPMVEKCDKKNMNMEDFIKKASYLMAIISWVQPFLDGNKRTGLVSAIKFLHENGYRLDMPREDQKEIRRLLYEIQDQRTSLDHSVVTKIIFYITKRTTIHEPK